MKAIFLTIVLSLMVCGLSFGYEGRPLPYGDGVYQKLNPDGSITVGQDNETGLVDIKYKYPFTTPVFGKYGLQIRDYYVYYAERDHTGASWVMKVDGGVVDGSFLGKYYLAGLNLHPTNYTEVKNWLWSSDGSIAHTPYVPLSDDFDNIEVVNVNDIYVPTVSLVDDSDRGVVFDYSTTEGSSTTNFTQRVDDYQKTTGIEATATGWTRSAWVKFPATALVVSGTAFEYPSNISVSVGELVAAATVQYISIRAVYGLDGNLDKIEAFTKSQVPVDTSFTLVASPTGDTWYHVAMICDGTTGIDYYVSDEDGVLLASADETDLPLPEAFNLWSTSYYGLYAFSGAAQGSVSINGSIVGLRFDENSFWTLD